MGRNRHVAEITPGQKRVSILIFFSLGQGFTQSLSGSRVNLQCSVNTPTYTHDGAGSECDKTVCHETILRKYEGHIAVSGLLQKILWFAAILARTMH